MAAKVESTSAYKGIGLVKLMGRQSGFITMQASMASGMGSFLGPASYLPERPEHLQSTPHIHPAVTLSQTQTLSCGLRDNKLHKRACMPCQDVYLSGRVAFHRNLKSDIGTGVVDVCLIPEVPFALKGSKGLFAYVEKVLEERGHCVMCIAEGAGQVSASSTLLGLWSIFQLPAQSVLLRQDRQRGHVAADARSARYHKSCQVSQVSPGHKTVHRLEHGAGHPGSGKPP